MSDDGSCEPGEKRIKQEEIEVDPHFLSQPGGSSGLLDRREGSNEYFDGGYHKDNIKIEPEDLIDILVTHDGTENVSFRELVSSDASDFSDGENPTFNYESSDSESGREGGVDSDISWGLVSSFKTAKFLAKAGLLVPPPGNNPMDFFDLVFDNAFLETVVRETNISGAKLVLHSPKKRATYEWKTLEVHEFKIFLALLFHMGTIKMARVQDYWKTEELFSIPCFARCMSRNRFLIILRALQLFPDTAVEKRNFNDLGIVKHFNNKMTLLYSPSRNLLVEPSTLSLRTNFATTNCKTANKLKITTLTEANGLFLRAYVHSSSGKKNNEDALMKLTEGLENRGHSLYLEKSYNSFNVARELLKKQIRVTGMLSKHAKNIPSIVIHSKNMLTSRFANGVSVAKWKARKDYFFLSTEFEPHLIECESLGDCYKEKPKPMVMCNKYISNEHQKQLQAYYPLERIQIKWSKKLDIHFLQLFLVNSYYLYNKIYKKLDFYHFRLTVIRSLLSEKTIPAFPIVTFCPKVNHLPAKYKKNVDGKQMRKRCKFCYVNNVRKNTPFFCPNCVDMPGLCLEPCFELFHLNVEQT